MELTPTCNLARTPTWSMVAARDGRIDAAVVRRKSVGSNPDSVWAADAMQRIGFTLSLTTHLNPGHFHGRGRLRSSCRYLPRDEGASTTTQESMFNFVRFSSGGQAAMSPELRSEVDIVAGLAERDSASRSV